MFSLLIPSRSAFSNKRDNANQSLFYAPRQPLKSVKSASQPANGVYQIPQAGPVNGLPN